ncbi:GNAT family N-acetyltransferase [Flavobacterium sp. TAB 87]|uniref:GNAT family N-acetyltransferase n=1 Tax=Flavobacterium sp. TAB 87 TaxID=1729581 RepID=UPI00076D0180|nr:GNAT family N-acetyltransferase [Flavobacterium sp. TAB 87]KVV13509.1 Acetyltransferase (GNAT) family protein [Flavobacterium sp. TAB 87]
MNKYKIDSGRLTLRAIVEKDLLQVHYLHSLEEVDQYNTVGIPENLQETESILQSWLKEHDTQNTQRFTFAVELNTDHQFIGLIGISLGKAKYKNAEVWFKFDPKFWNKGYATEALKELLLFGFEELRLHRIEAGCAVANLGSIQVLEKAGMRREAHTRQLLPLKSGWSDNYGYAKLASD